MIKQLIILSLAGFVACALAIPNPEASYVDEEPDSELALFEPDEVEAAEVKLEVFRDYCYKARDVSKAFLQSELNNAALKVYNAIFKSIEQIGANAAESGSKDVEFGRQMILDEKAARQSTAVASEEGGVVEPMSIDGEDDDENQVDQSHVPLAQRFIGSITGAFKKFLVFVADETWAHIAKVKEELKGENFGAVFQEACAKINKELAPRLEKEFGVAKDELNVATTDKEGKVELSTVFFENVNCVTTRRVLLASKLCFGVERIGPVFFPLLEYVYENRRS